MKIPRSQISSEELQKIFDESYISQQHFFSREVPSISSLNFSEEEGKEKIKTQTKKSL
ncbi:MAG: hypothetical protein GDA46_00375 [Bdellovibrionales bacterium]|nr:hypothetical protein [Bdellovibrionales bacterium]